MSNGQGRVDGESGECRRWEFIFYTIRSHREVEVLMHETDGD